MVGYAADMAELKPIKFWQNRVKGKCKIYYQEGVLNYEIYTNLAMSGSPLFVYN